MQTLLDQPPSTLPRYLALAGVVFCVSFGAWATFGQIDEVGHAQGRLVPKGEPYKINPVASGKIARIAIQEGQAVKAGQVLFELDNQIAANEVARLLQEGAGYQTQLLQTQAMIDKTRLEAKGRAEVSKAEQKAQEVAIAQAKSKAEAHEASIAQAKEKAATTRMLLTQMQTDAGATQARRERLKPLPAKNQELLAQLRVAVTAEEELVRKLKPLVQQGALSAKYLLDAEQSLRDRQNAVIKTQLDDVGSIRERQYEAEQSVRDRQRTITQTQGELQQTLAELDRLQAERQQVLAEGSRLQAELAQKQAQGSTTQVEQAQKIQQLEVQKTQLQAKYDENQKLLNKARAELKQLSLTAPVNGIVSSLNIRNIGEVVKEGQTVAEMAPDTAPLILSATLPNREAGFVKTGMTVQIKFDAFPYQEYGVISGKVISISPDSKPDERQGAVYRVEVTLDRNYVIANQKTVQFKAGQTASADIIIRRRRIADILLDPIRQLQKGGMSL